MYVPSKIDSSLLVSMHDDEPYTSTVSTAAWKKSHLMSSGSDDLHTVLRPSRALHVFTSALIIGN